MEKHSIFSSDLSIFPKTFVNASTVSIRTGVLYGPFLEVPTINLRVSTLMFEV